MKVVDPADFQKAAELVGEWDARAIHAIVRDGQRTAVDPRDLLRELIATALTQARAEECQRWEAQCESPNHCGRKAKEHGAK